MNVHNLATETLVLRILDAAGALERGMDGALGHTRGITFREYRLLRALGDAGDPGLTRVALARALSVTPSGVTRALKPLEKLGYVTTVKNERDARQSLACLTDGGRELVADAQGMLAEFFADLDLGSIDPAQLDALDALLGRIGKPG